MKHYIVRAITAGNLFRSRGPNQSKVLAWESSRQEPVNGQPCACSESSENDVKDDCPEDSDKNPRRRQLFFLIDIVRSDDGCNDGNTHCFRLSDELLRQPAQRATASAKTGMKCPWRTGTARRA